MLRRGKMVGAAVLMEPGKHRTTNRGPGELATKKQGGISLIFCYLTIKRGGKE